MSARTAPSPAERARTLALGVVGGVLHLETGDESTATRRVQQITGPDGELVLLVESGSRLHADIERHIASESLADVPCLLDVLDVPPGQLSLPRARLCVTGWAESVPVVEQRRLAGQVAAARPIGALLDVGSAWSLYRFDVAEIKLTTAAGTFRIGEREFAAAAADPLYESEDHIVGHLQTYHYDDAVAHVMQRLPAEKAAQLTGVTVSGLDRYGLDLLCAIGREYEMLRSTFPVRIDDENSLSQALTRLMCAPCSQKTAAM